MNIKEKKEAFNQANSKAVSLAREICGEGGPGPKYHLRGSFLVAYLAVSEILTDHFSTLGGQEKEARQNIA